jgi:S1-C subfamily serine protease
MNDFPIRRAAGLVARSSLAAMLCLGCLGARADSDAQDRAALEKQLATAREQLDQAARQVAELSRQLYGDRSQDIMPFVHGGRRGAMLGINLDSAQERDEGVVVAGVSPGGPAERAGLKAGDVIMAVDGRSLRRDGGRSAARQLVDFMRDVDPGEPVKVEYLREGRKDSATVATTAAEPPVVRILRERLPAHGLEGLPIPGIDALLGPERGFRSLELVPLTPKLGRYFGTDKGLLVVRAGGAAGLPLEEGDILQTIDGRAPENPGHAFRILRSYQPGENLKLGVLRDRKQLELEATLPAADPAAGPDPDWHAPPPSARPSKSTDAGPA